MPIRILEPGLAAKIAAGEVVERPASVVKELVENALDAGATRIRVEIKEGGKSLIRVIDNGCGIPPDQVSLAFERHATSKISSLEDLSNIRTLGFRGEALPSIAAVADVSLITRVEGENAGIEVRVERGSITHAGPHAATPGTRITVTGLFASVPARLKFLKATSTESGHIHSLVSRLALSNPIVAFTLVIDEREVLKHSGGTLFDALVNVYGVEVANAMISVAGEDAVMSAEGPGAVVRVHGFVSQPSVTRASRGYFSLFVNGRFVQSRILNYAVEEAYHTLLMEGRYPIAVLHVEVPADLLDVNVHPAKSEVRFQREREVFVAVQRAVRSALSDYTGIPSVGSRLTIGPETPVQNWMDLRLPPQPDGRPLTRQDAETGTQSATANQTVGRRLPLLRVLGQVAGTYVITEGPDGIYLIDQHTAHERVLYEQMRKEMAASAPSSQMLLEPIAWEVGHVRATELKRRLPALADLGFQIEPFGEDTLLIRAVPMVLKAGEVINVLNECSEMGTNGPEADWREKSMTVVVCHSAVRAGQVLSHEEMRQLVYQLEGTDLPYSCPHGRPTMVHMSQVQLEQEFKRR